VSVAGSEGTVAKWTARGGASYDHVAMSTVESRAHRRHVLRAPCIVRSKSDGRLVGDFTEDVSYSGVRIRTTTEAVRLGERVDVALQIPGSSLWLHGAGKVERAIPGRRAGETGPSIGVRLDRMDGLTRVLLTSIASQMPLVASSRGGRRDYAETVARIGRDG
jgi:hypothetical protein